MYGATGNSTQGYTPLGGAGYQGSGYGLDAASGTPSAMQQCKANITQIKSYAQRVEQLTILIGTASDTQQVRDDLRMHRESAVDLIKDTASLIQSPVKPSEEQTKRILMEEFQRAVAECRQLSQASMTKVASFPLNPQYNPHAQAAQLAGGAGNDLRMMQAQQQIPDDLNLVEITELEEDNTIIRERNEELHHLNEKLGDLKEIYKDTAMLVEVQQPMFDKAEEKAMKGSSITKDAVKHLQAAQKYQGRGRSKQCLMIMLLIGMVLVIGLIFALVIGVM